MSKKPDHRRASTDVRLELRRPMQRLPAQGKTHVEIAELAGYTRTYVSTMLKRLASGPAMLKSMSRGGRPQGSLRALSAKEERRTQALSIAVADPSVTLGWCVPEWIRSWWRRKVFIRRRWRTT